MKFIKHLHVNQKIINLSFKNIYIGRVSYHLARRIGTLSIDDEGDDDDK